MPPPSPSPSPPSSEKEKELEEQLKESVNRLASSLPSSSSSSVNDLLPLLDRIEICLSRVDQSPPDSLQKAIAPLLKLLANGVLFRHADYDVRVAVASCLSEITRITAPEPPYDDDDRMKDVFQLIVSSFERLHDKSSVSYKKSAMILDTMSNVRSCVLMLDLECSDLIVEMFHHFLKAIRDNHPENVFASMETIMTVVLEESGEILPELIASILSYLERGNKEVLPVAQKLGEKVLKNCASKLKPFLVQIMNSTGKSLDNYSKVVTDICQGAPCYKLNSMSVVGKKGSQHGYDLIGMRIRVWWPVDKEFYAGVVTQYNPVIGKHEVVYDDGDVEILDLKAEKWELVDDILMSHKNGPQATKKMDQTRTVLKAKASCVTKSKSQSKPEKIDNKRRRKNDSPDKSQSKKAGGGRKKVVLILAPSIDSASGKVFEDANVTDSKADKQTKLEAHMPKGTSPAAAAEGSNMSDAKSPEQIVKKDENASSLPEYKKKRAKEMPSSKKVVSGAPLEDNDNVPVCSPESSLKHTKDKSDMKNSAKSNSKRECAPGNQKANPHGYDLIDARIRVWWPVDKEFYQGVITEYSPVEGEHKVTYDDGDVEILVLKNEKWELVDDKPGPHTDHASQGASHDASSGMHKDKKAKSNPESATKQGRKLRSAAASLGKGESTPSSKSKKTNSKVDTLEVAKGGNLKDQKDSSAIDYISKSVANSEDDDMDMFLSCFIQKTKMLKNTCNSKVKTVKSGSKVASTNTDKLKTDSSKGKDDVKKSIESTKTPESEKVEPPSSSKEKKSEAESGRKWSWGR